MKKRGLHQSLHPFVERPFEVLSLGSWKPVEYLQISAGTISTQVVDEGNVYEENVLISNLRIRSRKATLSDCICYLRPGLDVCVLLTPQKSKNSCENHDLKPVWLDAKIKTIERKRHETGCDCQFYVKQNENIITVQIEQIYILQKLDRNPYENECFRWLCSEDCSSLQQAQLFPGKFASDLSWAVVASLLKKINFDIRLIQRKIVYRLVHYHPSEDCLDSCDQDFALNFKVENGISVPYVFAFTPCNVLEKGIHIDGDDNGKFSIYALLGVRRSKRRNIQPERYVDTNSGIRSQAGKYKKLHWGYVENLDEYASFLEKESKNDESGAHSSDSFANFKVIHNRTRPQKNPTIQEKDQVTRKDLVDSRNQSEETFSETFTEYRTRSQKNTIIQETDQVTRKDLADSKNHSEETFSGNFTESKKRTKLREKSAKPAQKSVMPNLKSEVKNQSYSKETFSSPVQKKGGSPRHADEISEVVIANAKSGRKSKHSYMKLQAKRYSTMYSPDRNLHRMGTSGKKSFSASVFKEMMAKCVENIKSTIGKDQPLVIDQWNEIQEANTLKRCDDLSDSSQTDDEDESELDLLWNEMDLCLASTYLLNNNKGSNSEVPESTNDGSEHVCEHEYKLNEEIGILCQLCGHVETEIKNVSPKFFERSKWIHSKGEFYDGDFEHKQDKASGTDLFSLNTISDMPLSEGENNVWTLIPDLRVQLRFHQKKAFEFLWRNIAGSLIPAQMQSTAKENGGCVISHSPGAGKTFLIIAFLESYLKLFPGCRPLVLAPKTILYAWYKEIKKWNLSYPVYRIHSCKNFICEALRVDKRSPKPHRDYVHTLDCMEKIQKWVSDPSLLIMGYPSFLSLTRGHTNCSYKQYMARILKQTPGILVLDEGHNPRATKSGLRKALMRVETKLRVLLSGTLFQNNFGEYFNTLALARPSFINEVLMELNPSFKRRKGNTSVQTRLLLENRSRKLFIERIAKKINAKSMDERAHGLNILRTWTSGFIDVYEGGNSNNLPGLQCYTLMMKSTPFQHELLVKLQNETPRHRGFPLELGSLITLASIHPWLIQTAAYASQHFTPKEMETLEKSKSDLNLGPKVKFVMSLLPRCIIKNEKVLIFCFNIAPIKLFVEIFESFFGWEKGEDILVITGDLELFERGRIMDKFEEKGSNSKVLLASIAACGEGVSLTAASRLILLDSQWNPSKTKQAIARAYRPGQQKAVYVYQLLASGTLEEDKYVRTTWKEWVSGMIFNEEIAEDHSRMKSEKIEDDVLREILEEDGASLFNKIIKNNEKASNSVVRDK